MTAVCVYATRLLLKYAANFEDLVFSTIIHRNARLSEAPSVGKPVILYDANSKGSMNYLNLAKEILQKNNLTKIPQEERTLEL